MIGIDDLHPGQTVLAAPKLVEHSEAIGDLLDTLSSHGGEYLHVRRYGPGLDELYIPLMAVQRVVEDHIYLNVNAEDLLAQPWHEHPGQ